MTDIWKEGGGEMTCAFNKAGGQTDKPIVRSGSRKKKNRSASPVTLRLTPEERYKLEELAVGMTLSAHIRACMFSEESRRRKRRPKNMVTDKKAVAEALALLEQSRIASNLNQLAYHANIGLLIEDEETKEQIAEANQHLSAIRSLLIKALGKSPLNAK